MREKKSSLISGKLYHITDEKLCSQRQDEITEQTYDGANIVRSIKYCRWVYTVWANARRRHVAVTRNLFFVACFASGFISQGPVFVLTSVCWNTSISDGSSDVWIRMTSGRMQKEPTESLRPLSSAWEKKPPDEFLRASTFCVWGINHFLASAFWLNCPLSLHWKMAFVRSTGSSL